MRYIVDLTGVKDREELHDRIAQALQFPEWYGKNLDSFHDMIGAMEGTIIFTGYDSALEALPSYAQGLRMVCLDTVEENPDLKIDFVDTWEEDPEDGPEDDFLSAADVED